MLQVGDHRLAPHHWPTWRTRTSPRQLYLTSTGTTSLASMAYPHITQTVIPNIWHVCSHILSANGKLVLDNNEVLLWDRSVCVGGSPHSIQNKYTYKLVTSCHLYRIAPTPKNIIGQEYQLATV